MSTELGKIKGRYEDRYFNGNPQYERSELHLTSFYGGKGVGKMLQVTISKPTIAYSQLTPDQVKKLIKKLSKWLAE